MNRAPTCVRPAANVMPLGQHVVLSLPARRSREGTRGHGDKGARGDGRGNGVAAARAARGAAPPTGAASLGCFLVCLISFS